MKTKTLAGLTLLFALCFTACGESETTQNTNKVASKDALLILIDKTISSAPPEARQQEFLDHTVRQVVETLQNPGDCVRGHFIQENTTGSTAFLRSPEIPAYEAPQGGGGKSIKEAELKYRSKLDGLRGQCNRQLREGAALVNTTGTQLHTDLWGVLELASKMFSESAYQSKQIIILSDMEESMPGEGRRDFYSRPIASKEEAEAFAEADAPTLLRLFDIDPQVLAGAEVTIFSPFDALEDSDFALNRYYWESLLEAFGVTDVHWR